MEAEKNADDGHLDKEKRLLKSLRESEKEKNILLMLSNEMASIKNKMELLPLLHDKFKKHSFYTDLSISIINDDGKTTSGYLIDWEKKRHKHHDYAKESTAKHNLADGILDTTLAAKKPVIFKLEEIIKWDKVPSYIQFLYDRGIRDMIAVALYNRTPQ
jgi:formate hydrogenlyase transcriptional activator